ncbi:DUF924 family protein [Novosphingobium sp.]|uniref:DUF924 family protein n=1 Tax=Novosphingobium sp. TaxID=1874826 RepID=UPI0025ED21D9|nr:DUF924 family protein [Novosphingobium sp.]
MALASPAWAADLLHVWFHVLKPAQWYKRDDAVDAMLARRFARRVGPFSYLSADRFLTNRDTARAAILLFDQIPRNCFRGSPAAFAADPLARALSRAAIARGWHRGLPKGQAQFVLLPLMHSEHAEDQRASLHRFAELGDARNLRFAREHARMIFRFGRFPHRNAVLGRRSSAAEQKAIAAGNVW